MALGVVTTLAVDRGFGFLQPQEGREAVFFHRQSMRRVEFDTLAVGAIVEFELTEGDASRGPRAANVRVYRGERQVAIAAGEPFEPLAAHHRAKRRKPTWRRATDV